MTQKAVEEDEDDPNSSRLEFDVEAFGEIGDPLKEPEHKTTKNLSENNTMRSFDEITLDEVGVDPLEEPDSSPSINTFQSKTQTKVILFKGCTNYHLIFLSLEVMSKRSRKCSIRKH